MKRFLSNLHFHEEVEDSTPLVLIGLIHGWMDAREHGIKCRENCKNYMGHQPDLTTLWAHKKALVHITDFFIMETHILAGQRPIYNPISFSFR